MTKPVRKTPVSPSAPAKKRAATPASKKVAVKAPVVKAAAVKPAIPTPAPKTQVVASANPAATVVKVKNKLVRDSFTIPKSEYAVLEGLKVRAANLKRPTKKSEVLRAGVAVLSAMSDNAFLAALNAVPSLKTGRPKGA